LGLFRGTSLALFGVSNGALQFVAYERMKRWGFELKKKQFELAGRPWTPDVDKLVRPFPSACLGFRLTATVKHVLLTHVWREQNYCSRNNLSLPSCSLQNTGPYFLFPEIPAESISAEQCHQSFIPHHPRYYWKNLGPRGRPGILSRSRHKFCPRPSWDLRDVRRV
jgi:hypothetical protein